MKIKTIERVVKAKLTAWLDSIEDSDLRADVRTNIVLSGGSITSLLLQEPVNDFDVYLKDIEVLERLAKYYAKGFVVLNGNRREEYIKEKTEGSAFSEEDDLSQAMVIYKSLHPGQIKLYVNGAGVEAAKGDEKPFHPVFFSQNAISLSDQIQIVLRFSGTVEEIHKSFDFIHATNYFTFEEGLVTNIKALECILTKELKYQGSLYPLTSIIRMKKFITRKWTMNAGEVLKILFQVSELDLKDPVVLEEQLIGVDIAYFSQLIEILRGVSPDKINSIYLSRLIDKVFNNFDGDEETVIQE
jgi:hypothetical protein